MPSSNFAIAIATSNIAALLVAIFAIAQFCTFVRNI